MLILFHQQEKLECVPHHNISLACEVGLFLIFASEVEKMQRLGNWTKTVDNWVLRWDLNVDLSVSWMSGFQHSNKQWACFVKTLMWKP